MTKYRVNLYTTASAVVEVEADSLDEAIDMAFEDAPYACHQCPEIGDWQLGSEMWPDAFKAEDDVCEVSDD